MYEASLRRDDARGGRKKGRGWEAGDRGDGDEEAPDKQQIETTAERRRVAKTTENNTNTNNNQKHLKTLIIN